MKNKLIHLLERTLNSRGKKLTKQDEYMFFSPFVSHYKPKLQINIESQKWHCWISNQGGHSLYSLFKKVNADTRYFSELRDIVFIPTNKNEVESKVIVSLPKEYQALSSKSKSLFYRHAINFLKRRGINETDIKKYKLGFCDNGVYQNRIIIPSYDDNGLLNYFVGRSFMGDGMKYKNPNVSRDIIPFDWFIAWSYPIVLCEGVFDAISIRTNAIPMLSKKPPKSLLRKVFEKKVKTIYIALDDDAKKDAYRLSEFFKDFGIDSKVVNLPKDKDPNDLGFDKITDLIGKTISSSFSDMIQARLYG
jgi:DNA primase